MFSMVSKRGTTALMSASKYRHIEVVNVLLAAGANVNIRSNVSSRI